MCSDPYEGGSEELGAVGCLAACSSGEEREVSDLSQSRSDDPRYNLRTFHRPNFRFAHNVTLSRSSSVMHMQPGCPPDSSRSTAPSL